MITSANLVPAKSYGDYLDKINYSGAYGFSMDWLCLNFHGAPDVSIIDRWEFVPLETKTRVFDEMGNVYFDDVLIGTMTFSPRMKNINEELVQLKLENSLFYLLPLEKIRDLIQLFTEFFGLKFASVNRLDLALDFDGKNHGVEDVIKLLNVGALRVAGRSKELKFFYKSSAGISTLEGFQIGSRKSLRFARCYNKTVEMEKNHKVYIADYWEKLGLTGQVWRMEYQMSNKYLRTIKGVTLDSLFDLDFLYGLYQEANKNFFELHENTGKSEVNKEVLFNWFDLSRIRIAKGFMVRFVEKLKRRITESLIGQKRMVKGLLRSYCSTAQDKDYMKPILRILSEYRISEWFFEKLDPWLIEFEKKSKIRGIDKSQLLEDMNLNSVLC